MINWINAEKEKIQRKANDTTHPVLLAFQFHLKYLTIHPFYDGNGRTARILTNLILISYGFPPIYIKDAEKEKYYTYLGKVQAYGADENLLYSLLFDCLIRSLNIIVNAMEGKEMDEPDDIEKRIALLTKRLSDKQIVNSIKSNETVYNQLKDGIFPLFKELEAKLEKLRPLFHDFSKDASYQGNLAPVQIAVKESNWAIIEAEWLDAFFQGEISFNKLIYNYGLFGFKSSLTNQNFGFNIDFQFDQYSFELKINSANKQAFSYDHPLSEAERNKIIKIIMDGLLERIEDATK